MFTFTWERPREEIESIAVDHGDQSPLRRLTQLYSDLIATLPLTRMTLPSVAIVAGLFGFGVIASGAADIAMILFFVFLVLLVISLVMHVARGRRPPV